ncbi:hypothetical protein HDU87_008708 [Geranomyces variabilis]|uniref:Velvet domain-containing protein n=1 Tax=Geranomyces variabilis TaxID=109894 RepID=A0AAD5TCQ4_9FUNG|nr:hypothetical protein HDU87_008708 [Geranomyces variabilis]
MRVEVDAHMFLPILSPGGPNSDDDAATLVVHASLWSADGTEDRNVVVSPYYYVSRQENAAGSGGGSGLIAKAASITDGADADTDSASPTPSDSSKESRDMIQTLVGSVVSQCMPLQDMDGRGGLFAIFHDLSIRTPGQYRIRFSLLKLIIAPPQEPPISTPILASALSEPVAVFQPKRFPGLLATTPLSEHFASQGLPIHVRKFIKPKRGVKSRETHDGTD